MKFLVFFILALAYGQADVNELNEKDATILRQSFDIASDSSQFSYGFETSNNIKVDAAGVVNNINSDNPDLETQGNVAYSAPDGQLISYGYKSGIGGFQAEGAHLPTPPPTPDYILRLLEFLATATKYKSDKK